DPETLDELSANYLACYDRNTLAYLDVSTGEAFYYSFNDFNDAEKILTLLPPAELVLSSEQKCEFLRRGKVTYCLTAHEFNATELPSLYQELPKSCQRLVAYAAHMQGPEIFATLNGFEP